MKIKFYIVLYFLLWLGTAERLVIGQDFWEQIEIPDSMGTMSMIIDEEGTIFVGSGGNSNGVKRGIYYSNDNGVTWNYKFISAFTVYSLGINTLGDIFAGCNGIIYKSIDKGETWYQVYGIAQGNILCFTTGFDSLVFAGSFVNDGIIRSTDYGENWEVIHSFEFEEMVYDIEISNDGIMYAGTNNIYGITGVYKSLDLGETWEYIGPDAPIFSLEILDNGEILAGTNGDGLQKYSNGNWEIVVPYISPTSIAREINTVFLSYKWNYAYGGVMISYDNGQTFEVQNSGIPSDGPLSGVKIAPNNYVYIYPSSWEGSFICRSINPITSITHSQQNLPKEVIVFPNPATDFITFKNINYPNYELFEISISNIRGDIVEQFLMNDELTIEFCKEHFIKGIYLYTIRNKDYIQTGKFIILTK